MSEKGRGATTTRPTPESLSECLVWSLSTDEAVLRGHAVKAARIDAQADAGRDVPEEDRARYLRRKAKDKSLLLRVSADVK